MTTCSFRHLMVLKEKNLHPTTQYIFSQSFAQLDALNIQMLKAQVY